MAKLKGADLVPEVAQHRLVGDHTKRKDDSQARHRTNLTFQKRSASRDLGAGRFVLWRYAAYCIGNAAIFEANAIISCAAVNTLCKAELDKRGI